MSLIERMGFMLLRAVVCMLLAGFLSALANKELCAEGLGKDPIYFYDRYGSQKSSKAVVGYQIYTPFKYNQVPIEEPCLIRKYSKEGISLDVLLSDPGLEALWVRITLKEKWTDESLAAGLAAYGSDWKRLTSDSGLGLEIPLIHVKRLYRSGEGRIAFFSPVVNQLMIYSADSIAAAKVYESAREETKAKVPVF